MLRSRRFLLAFVPALALTAPVSTQQTASYEFFAPGCPGSVGIPSIAPAFGDLPLISETFFAVLTNAPQDGHALAITGLSSTDWSGFPLPMDLASIRMPNCLLYTDIRRTANIKISSGRGTWALRVPNIQELIGQSFYQQVLVLDTAVPGLGAIMSDAYEGVIGSTSEQRLDTDPSGLAGSFAPQVASSGDSVYVAWEDQRNGSEDIYFNGSLDGGGSWLSSDIRLNTDLPGAARSRAPQVAASGASVYVTWVDRRNGSEDIYFNRSLDGGGTWLSSDTRLNTDLPGAAKSLAPQIAAAGSAVYVTWYDERNGAEDIYFNRSLDAGASWLPVDLRLDTDLPGKGGSIFPQIAAAGDSVYVVWTDRRVSLFTESDIYFNRSLDRGATWLVSDKRMDTDLPGAAPSANPKVAAAGDSVYVIWEEKRTSQQPSDIYFNRSLDNGTSFKKADSRVNRERAFVAFGYSLAAAGDSVYVAWPGTANGLTSSVFNRSLDGGDTWLPNEVRLGSSLPGVPSGVRPQLAASGSALYASWEHSANGSTDIRFNRSLDGGDSWLPTDIQMGSNLGSGLFQQISVSNDAAYVTWSDRRNGQADIYLNRHPR